ncbi:phage holin family protein [Paenibacillus sp. N1-5-1-14]|uniref:phage holin family protein n=1 Tax=Paenibacillus radicibacter TaxID=2972488 RepID=UPI00215989F6|nr:phage holin family protein [Paenibacillus radicibacter]MCR8644915.1 phage holin family protein [Paenibacillus radicibacter]
MSFLGTVVRFIVSAFVLMLVSWFVKGFSVGGFTSALLLALAIAVIAFIVESMFGRRITPFGRGVVGFLTSAVIIWVAQFIVPGVTATVLGAILSALVIGLIDLFIPMKTPFEMGSDWSGKDKEPHK